MDETPATAIDERLIGIRQPGAPDPRGPAPGAWFGAAVAAVYLGVGEGARRDVTRWAIDRRPGDGSTAVAMLVRLRFARSGCKSYKVSRDLRVRA